MTTKALEDLKVYQYYVDLMFYEYNITAKFPKFEKHGIVSDIKNASAKGLEIIIDAQKEFDIHTRIYNLNMLDSKLKVLKTLVRISYKNKYINSRNYGSWSRKIAAVSNTNAAWIKSCLNEVQKNENN